MTARFAAGAGAGTGTAANMPTLLKEPGHSSARRWSGSPLLLQSAAPDRASAQPALLHQPHQPHQPHQSHQWSEAAPPQLTDSLGRQFGYLRLSITERCNFSCQYCLPDGNICATSADLSLSEIINLVRAFAALGTRKVRISGGEPSLRKDLCQIISAIKAVPGIDTVALSSNGYRLFKDARDYRAAGLDQLNISVDSLDAATFALVTGQDRLPQILAGIDLACTLGFQAVKLNTVLLKQHNGASLPQFIDFVQQRPVTLRFIELMQTGAANSYFRKNHLSAANWQQQLQQQGWQAVPKHRLAGPALEYQHADALGRLGFIMPYQPGFCADCNRLRVSSQGQLFLCLFAEQHQNLRPMLADPQQQAALQSWLRQQVKHKAASHQLLQQQSGATHSFSMIGG